MNPVTLVSSSMTHLKYLSQKAVNNCVVYIFVEFMETNP